MCSAGLDGTWGGMQDSVSAQVIIFGASVIGFYWRDDYLVVTDPAFSIDRRKLSFNFNGGTATMTRGGERTASLHVSAGGQVVNLNLQRD